MVREGHVEVGVGDVEEEGGWVWGVGAAELTGGSVGWGSRFGPHVRDVRVNEWKCVIDNSRIVKQ